MPKRIALLVNNFIYQDKTLSRLTHLDADNQTLSQLLLDPNIANFDQVQTLINHSAREIRQHISRLFGWKKQHDLLLLYYSGYIIQNEAGQLYLSAPDTSFDAIETTAIPATHITEAMDYSFSRRQLLILDCYHARVQPQPMHQELEPTIGIAATFKGKGYGRTILAANDAVQFLMSGENVSGSAEKSRFTHFLIRGLETGDADADGDRQIDVKEIYNYISQQNLARAHKYKPQLWAYHPQDKIILAYTSVIIQPQHLIKWDLIFGAIMAPLVTILIGATASLSNSVGMAGVILLLYAFLYWTLE